MKEIRQKLRIIETKVAAATTEEDEEEEEET